MLFWAFYCYILYLSISIHPYVLRTAGFLVLSPVVLSTPLSNAHYLFLTGILSSYSVSGLNEHVSSHHFDPFHLWGRRNGERMRTRGMWECTIPEVSLLLLNTALFKQMFKCVSISTSRAGLNTPVAYVLKHLFL